MWLSNLRNRVFGRDIVESAIQASVRWSKYNYGKVFFIDTLDILLDVANDVELVNKSISNNNLLKFKEYKKFFDTQAGTVYTKLFLDGYVPIIYDGTFRIANVNEYNVTTNSNGEDIYTINTIGELVVITSEIYQSLRISDYQLLKPFLDYIDSILSSSNAIYNTLGCLLILSPSQPSNSPTQVFLRQEDKEQIEDDISQNYGLDTNKKQALVFSKPMNTNVVGLDKSNDIQNNLKGAVSEIAARLKVPVEKVPLLTYDRGYGLSNGGALSISDLNLIRSYERLHYRVFGILAERVMLDVDYTIYNKYLTNNINNEN